MLLMGVWLVGEANGAGDEGGTGVKCCEEESVLSRRKEAVLCLMASGDFGDVPDTGEMFFLLWEGGVGERSMPSGELNCRRMTASAARFLTSSSVSS